MNDLDLCLEVVSRSGQPLRICATFDVEYLGNRLRQGLVIKGP